MNRPIGSPPGQSKSLMTSIKSSAAGHVSLVDVPVTLPLRPGCCGMALLLQRDRLADRGQVTDRRPVEHMTESVEPRAVQRAVPGAHGRIPMDDAAQVRAGGRAFVQLAPLVAIDGDFVQPAADDRTGAGRDLF